MNNGQKQAETSNNNKAYILSKIMELNDGQLIKFMNYLIEAVIPDSSAQEPLDGR